MGQDEGNRKDVNGHKKIDSVCQHLGASGFLNIQIGPGSWAPDPIANATHGGH